MWSRDQSKNLVVQISDLTQLKLSKGAMDMFYHDAMLLMIDKSIPTRHYMCLDTLVFSLIDIHKTSIAKQVLRAQADS